MGSRELSPLDDGIEQKMNVFRLLLEAIQGADCSLLERSLYVAPVIHALSRAEALRL
jgi:hypothetical protein